MILPYYANLGRIEFSERTRERGGGAEEIGAKHYVTHRPEKLERTDDKALNASLHPIGLRILPFGAAGMSIVVRMIEHCRERRTAPETR